MSKEQTPITAEEWSIEEHIKALLVLRGFSKEHILDNMGVIGAVIEDMEQYAQAKVLEALEGEAEIINSAYGRGFADGYMKKERQKNYYETEVKPNYE